MSRSSPCYDLLDFLLESPRCDTLDFLLESPCCGPPDFFCWSLPCCSPLSFVVLEGVGTAAAFLCGVNVHRTSSSCCFMVTIGCGPPPLVVVLSTTSSSRYHQAIWTNVVNSNISTSFMMQETRSFSLIIWWILDHCCSTRFSLLIDIFSLK